LRRGRTKELIDGMGCSPTRCKKKILPWHQVGA
jgi:hypothetical protein